MCADGTRAGGGAQKARLSEAAGPVPPAFCAPCIAPDQRKNDPSRAAALRPARLPFFSHIIQRGVCPSEIIIYRPAADIRLRKAEMQTVGLTVRRCAVLF